MQALDLRLPGTLHASELRESFLESDQSRRAKLLKSH
jgi:hypothetical protein